ncbi:hypothetical protein [uncultured Shewanella sp.]|uniref:hypothetical protein n=1 Tax=uncultured Shewanella sp. TaxID=173975 RepID=UPI00261DE9A1|nr:hypothetical protein [uncultured Shewanella sp.]
MNKFHVILMFGISLIIGLSIDVVNYNIGFYLDYNQDTGYDIILKIAYIIFLSSIQFTVINILTAYYIKEHTKKSILEYMIMKIKPQKKTDIHYYPWYTLSICAYSSGLITYLTLPMMMYVFEEIGYLKNDYFKK